MNITSNPYDQRFKEQLNLISKSLIENLDNASKLSEIDAKKLISLVLEQACQCTNERNITLGQQAALELPRFWLLERIESVAEKAINFDDEWEFRRLLELAQSIDSDWLNNLIVRGLESSNPEVIEAANDFKLNGAPNKALQGILTRLVKNPERT